MNPSPTLMHQEVARRLAHRLVDQVEEAGRGWGFIAPTDVILYDLSVPVPDLVMVRKERRAERTRRVIEGAPDATYAIRESWRVHPEEAWVEVLELRRGRYVRKDRFSPPEAPRTAASPEVAVAAGGSVQAVVRGSRRPHPDPLPEGGNFRSGPWAEQKPQGAREPPRPGGFVVRVSGRDEEEEVLAIGVAGVAEGGRQKLRVRLAVLRRS